MYPYWKPAGKNLHSSTDARRRDIVDHHAEFARLVAAGQAGLRPDGGGGAEGDGAPGGSGQGRLEAPPEAAALAQGQVRPTRHGAVGPHLR